MKDKALLLEPEIHILQCMDIIHSCLLVDVRCGSKIQQCLRTSVMRAVWQSIRDALESLDPSLGKIPEVLKTNTPLYYPLTLY